MFCDLTPTDTIALWALGVSVGVFLLLVVHAVIFWIQAGSLNRSVTDARDKEQRELRAYLFPEAFNVKITTPFEMPESGGLKKHNGTIEAEILVKNSANKKM